MKKNGLSGKVIYKLDAFVYKEKNNNHQNLEKIIKLLNENNFKYSAKFKDIDSKIYAYNYLKGKTLKKVITMPFESTLRIIEIVLELQNLYTDSLENVIVHGDLSPVNVVYDKNLLPIKIIDWDGCYIGSKYDDIAYICWLWVNFGDIKREHQKYINQIIAIFKFLNYTLDDVGKVRQSILKRISKDKHNITNKIRKAEIQAWYEYTEKWVENNWKDIINAFN